MTNHYIHFLDIAVPIYRRTRSSIQWYGKTMHVRIDSFLFTFHHCFFYQADVLEK
jgi:hypothetical protein